MKNYAINFDFQDNSGSYQIWGTVTDGKIVLEKEGNQGAWKDTIALADKMIDDLVDKAQHEINRLIRCYGDEAFEHFEDFRRNGWTELLYETYEEKDEDYEYVVMISATVAKLDD